MTSTFFRRIFILLIITISFPVLNAQDYKYEIGGMAGGAFYMGDANKGVIMKGLNPSLGGVFRYNANFRWALKADLLWAKVSGNTKGLDNVFPFSEDLSFSQNLFELGGQAEFNFLPYSDKYAYMNTSRITPYLLAGLGFTVATGEDKTFAGINIPLGIGVKYKLKERINLGCEFSFRKLFGDGLEGNEKLKDPYNIKSSIWKNKDWYSCLLFFITWDFGPRSQPCNNANSISGY
ncbi:DUF6089 family protein [Parabacteroides sp. OttesenSCG-928-G21]|nr:DUF6089 family protein [Parabacteroides sp. OttesenSCG-928-G21]